MSDQHPAEERPWPLWPGALTIVMLLGLGLVYRLGGPSAQHAGAHDEETAPQVVITAVSEKGRGLQELDATRPTPEPTPRTGKEVLAPNSIQSASIEHIPSGSADIEGLPEIITLASEIEVHSGDVPAYFMDIAVLAKSEGLRMHKFVPQHEIPGEIRTAALRIVATGSYEDVESFLGDLTEDPFSFPASDLSFLPEPDDQAMSNSICFSSLYSNRNRRRCCINKIRDQIPPPIQLYATSSDSHLPKVQESIEDIASKNSFNLPSFFCSSSQFPPNDCLIPIYAILHFTLLIIPRVPPPSINPIIKYLLNVSVPMSPFPLARYDSIHSCMNHYLRFPILPQYSSIN